MIYRLKTTRIDINTKIGAKWLAALSGKRRTPTTEPIHKQHGTSLKNAPITSCLIDEHNQLSLNMDNEEWKHSHNA